MIRYFLSTYYALLTFIFLKCFWGQKIYVVPLSGLGAWPRGPPGSARPKLTRSFSNGLIFQVIVCKRPVFSGSFIWPDWARPFANGPNFHTACNIYSDFDICRSIKCWCGALKSRNWSLDAVRTLLRNKWPDWPLEIGLSCDRNKSFTVSQEGTKRSLICFLYNYETKQVFFSTKTQWVFLKNLLRIFREWKVAGSCQVRLPQQVC